MYECVNQYIEEHFDEMLQNLIDLVKIRSVVSDPEEGAPFGKEPRRAMQYVLDLAENLGLKVVNLDNKVCYAEYGTGDHVIGSFAHLDIVPEGENWTYPPFGGEIHDGKIYGRGTVDNKAPFLASLYGLLAIRECGLPMGNFRIRVVGGTAEEVGMQDMKTYIDHCGAPDAGFTPDGWFPMSFTERGISYWYLQNRLEELDTGKIRLCSLHGGGDALNLVADKCSVVLRAQDEETCRRVMEQIAEYKKDALCSFSVSNEDLEIRISALGKVAHACAPFDGKNAIQDSLLLLKRIGFSGSLGVFLERYAQLIGLTTDCSLLGMKYEDECGKLTFNLSRMDIEDNEIQWVVNLRYPHTYSDKMFKDFEERLNSLKTVLLKRTNSPSLMYAKDGVLIRTLRSVYEDCTGLDSEPGNGGGTYAKVIPNIVALGNQFPGSTDWCHRADENLSLDEFLLQAKIYAHAMYELGVAIDREKA